MSARAIDVPWGVTWPALAGFRDLAGDRRVIPVVRRLLADDATPVGLYRTLAGGRAGTGRGASPPTLRASASTYAGPDPQHPPTTLTIPASANPRTSAAIASGVSS